MILLDTNILLRLKEKHAESHQTVKNKIQQFLQIGEKLVLTPQIVYEFYVVATRPLEKNGLGLEVVEVIETIEEFSNLCQLLVEHQDTYQNWLHLMRQYQIKGKRSHDVRLVAFMQAQQIPKLYTLNQQDFKVFQNLIELI